MAIATENVVDVAVYAFDVDVPSTGEAREECVVGDLSQELSSHKALYNSAVTRNAERRVQLVSTYGEEEIDAYGLEELENFFNDANPKFEQINHAMEELATNIRVLEPARNSSP